MSIKKLNVKLFFILLLFISNDLFAQESEQADAVESTEIKVSQFGSEVRGKTAFTAGIGTATMNGDLPDSQLDIYFSAGFKQFLSDYININLTYHKFNLVFGDVFNEGFMSFDFNVETYFSPYSTFTPFLYAGGGLHASNYFTQSYFKAQFGGGIEVLVSQNVGIKLYADYNYVFSDLVENIEFGDANDLYYRIGAGINYYFGKPLKNKLASEKPTVKDSLSIEDDN